MSTQIDQVLRTLTKQVLQELAGRVIGHDVTVEYLDKVQGWATQLRHLGERLEGIVAMAKMVKNR